MWIRSAVQWLHSAGNANEYANLSHVESRFTAGGYHSLVSRYTLHSNDRRRQQSVDECLAVQYLGAALCKFYSTTRDHWRRWWHSPAVSLTVSPHGDKCLLLTVALWELYSWCWPDRMTCECEKYAHYHMQFVTRTNWNDTACLWQLCGFKLKYCNLFNNPQQTVSEEKDAYENLYKHYFLDEMWFQLQIYSAFIIISPQFT